MKFLSIANNIEGNNDGIGKHARIVGNAIIKMGHKVDYCVGTTWNKSLFKKMISMEMCNAYKDAINKIGQSYYDFVVIEYPFCEYNPIVLYYHRLLFEKAHKLKTKVAFSMHEYDRVSPLRRMLIKGFLPYCDILFITELKYKKELPQYADKMWLRQIASQGMPYYPNLKNGQSLNRFCYLGLVNKSKAFKEMLIAWNKFNRNNTYHLDVVSNSDLSEYNLDDMKGVKLHTKLSDDDAGKVLSSCCFSIIPVVPSIGYNNSSFVTAIQCGCIPIGCFNQDLCKEPFIINANGYDEKNFCHALELAVSLNEKDIYLKREQGLTFGKRFSVEKTAEMMINGFKDYESKHKK